MVTVEKVLSLVETQGPLVAKIGRGAIEVYNAVKEKKYFVLFAKGQAVVEDVTALVAVVKEKFADPEPVKMGASWVPLDYAPLGGLTVAYEKFPVTVSNCCGDPADCSQPCAMKAAPVGSLAFGKGPGHRLFARRVRAEVRDKLRTEGFASVGKFGGPLSRDRVDELMGHLDDDTILTAGQEVGAIGDGKILQGLQNLLDWLLANSDKIAKLVQFLISLLSAF